MDGQENHPKLVLQRLTMTFPHSQVQEVQNITSRPSQILSDSVQEEEYYTARHCLQPRSPRRTSRSQMSHLQPGVLREAGYKPGDPAVGSSSGRAPRTLAAMLLTIFRMASVGRMRRNEQTTCAPHLVKWEGPTLRPVVSLGAWIRFFS